jgi:hyperosmotically inducible protein
VNVKTDNGVVLLSGFVQSEQQARRALQIAASVEGVQSVKSNLVVKS